jgi:taurine---2-oxoglutarate transaminase
MLRAYNTGSIRVLRAIPDLFLSARTWGFAERPEKDLPRPQPKPARDMGAAQFALIELVEDRATREPLVPVNPPASVMGPMLRLNTVFRERGLYTMVRWNSVVICPPLCISAEQPREGLAIIDEGLELIDAEVRG